ncbi:MAG TPA: HD domain-containing protein [Nocardioidaceae bacterium]|nr:HD domain-containing protein [Nocardioidaceae bacterium]
MAAVGSPAWVSRTRGAMSVRDQVGFALTAAAREVGGVAASLRKGSGRVVDSDRTPPDTRLAIGMAELSAAALPAPILRHSLRTWLWGSMLAEIDGIAYDEELLYVAAMLHDLGLAEAHRPPEDAACFAVHGAAEARSLTLGAGADDDFADGVAAAIAAHFNVSVPLAWGAEAHLLHAGAHFDVVGRRLGEVAVSTVAEVLQKTPRTGFADCFVTAMREEARLRPRSRAALLQQLGMERSVRRAKFPAIAVRGTHD